MCVLCVSWWQTGKEYVLTLLGLLSHVTDPRVIKYVFTLLENVLDCEWLYLAHTQLLTPPPACVCTTAPVTVFACCSKHQTACKWSCTAQAAGGSHGGFMQQLVREAC